MTVHYAIRRTPTGTRVQCLHCGATSDLRPTRALQAAWKQTHRCPTDHHREERAA